MIHKIQAIMSSNALSITVALASGTASLLLAKRMWPLSSENPKIPPLPPGPRGLPVLGSLLSMDSARVHESIADLCKQYGPIVSYRLGTQLFIVISDYELAKEMLEDENFTGRPQTVAFQRQIGGYGLLFSEGPQWRLHRSLAMKTLRSFGFASTKSAEIINKQMDSILEDLQSAQRPMKVLELFSEVTNAVIATLTMGRPFKRGGSDLKFMMSATQRLFATRPLLNLPFLFPSTDYLVRLFPSSNELNQVNDEILQFIGRLIRERQQRLSEEGGQAIESECLCDVYLREREKAEAAGDSETFKDKQLIRVIFDLILAGTESTARTMEWLLLYMAFEPTWQSRIQAEIDGTAGSSSPVRRPTMDDREQLPLTRAVIEEVQRLASVAGIGLFHRPVKDAEFHGYSFPSDALIIPFIYGMSRDPKLWSRPLEFYPEHFLNKVDGTFNGAEKSIPFSVGRRVCAGKSLASMEIFLMFSAVMQRFTVRVTDECASRREEILRGSMGIFRQPGDYELVFEAR